METAREMLKPFRSNNGHFQFDFEFYCESLDKGIMQLTFLKSNTKPNSYEFEIDSTDGQDSLWIKNILIVDAGGFTGHTCKPAKECLEFLKTGIRDTAISYFD